MLAQRARWRVTRKGIGCMSNLRKQAEAVAQSICDNDGFLQSEHIDLIEAFGQQMQEEEREALVAMIQDDKGYPRQNVYGECTVPFEMPPIPYCIEIGQPRRLHVWRNTGEDCSLWKQ